MRISNLLSATLLLVQSSRLVAGHALRLSSAEFVEVENADRELQSGGNRFTSRLRVVFDADDSVDPNDIRKLGDFNTLDRGLRSSSSSSSDDLPDVDLDDVLGGLITVYNDLVSDIVDPFQRNLDNVQVASGEVGENDEFVRHERVLRGGRRLFSIQYILSVAGPCTGCPSDARLTNQIIPMGPNRELQTKQKKSRSQETGARVDSEDEPGYETHDPPSNPEEPPSPDDPDRFLPTEEELRRAWSHFIVALQDPVIRDVTDLEEIGLPQPPPTTSKSSKDGSNSNSSKSSKASKNSSKSGPKGVKSSKSSKSSSKGMSGGSSKSDGKGAESSGSSKSDGKGLSSGSSKSGGKGVESSGSSKSGGKGAESSGSSKSGGKGVE
eukprot:CAMPEP_0117033948 /NCGR_PEP_ID=MMETSP0472-20121206/24219_1 /TAXON_ID=693140 ORGANISM="Tiarina fusus, Strain LIS" /NCGR_SAMPLE_ID=MMETSP0472 /ASSEMBLY_ACC=CAM_ASM_000603 /LENGTH=380 /DNA_ID=CAMNT_0004743009 /DNA_START=24 /DNA_END=1163 /DNA_ORIENTATION=+